MREVRTIDQNTKSLESYFEAFSFTGSQTLELEAEVETCLDRCRPVQCKIASGRSDDDFETVQSYGRRRRRSLIDPDHATRGDVVDERTLHRTLVIVTDAPKDHHQPTQRPTFSGNPPTFKTSSGMLSFSGPRVTASPDAEISSGKQRPPQNPSLKRKPTDGKKKIGHSGKPTKPYASNLLAYELDADGYYCFEANTLSAISGITLLIQGASLVVALALANRFRRRRPAMRIGPHRSAFAAASTISTVSSSRTLAPVSAPSACRRSMSDIGRDASYY